MGGQKETISTGPAIVSCCVPEAAARCHLRATRFGGGESTCLSNFPDSDGTKWNAAGREVDATALTWQLTAYALCAVVAA